MANIKAIGIVDPLCVCKEGDVYYILDGYVRYQILLELGVDVAPCLFIDSKDLYTHNRQVQNLSPKQEVEQLRKALKIIDEKTLAAAFGLTSLRTRLGSSFSKYLHPTVSAALEDGHLTRGVAKELTNVLPKRQIEIMDLMKEAGDWTIPFVRAQVLRTPQPLRAKKKYAAGNPWDRGASTKRNLVARFQEAEKHEEFYGMLYRQYSGDFLKVAIYIRQILNRPTLRKQLQKSHGEILKFFETVLQESEPKNAVG